MKKGRVILSLVLMVLSLSVPFAQPATAAPTVKPVFRSSFIQSWYCRNWDSSRWEKELSMLRDAGITEVIIQTTVDTTSGIKTAFYPTSIAGYTANEIDMLDKVLTVADSLEMKVRVGVGFNKDWWSKGAGDRAWLTREANENKLFVDEIAENYAGHPSFGGWHISYEISNITATTSTKQANLNKFYKIMVNEMKLKTPDKTVMVSPFYNSRYSTLGSLTNWSAAIKNIFSDTNVDILALQDSIGVNYNQISQLASIFTYTKKGTDAAKMQLYANNETFALTASGLITAPQARLTSQMAAVNEYVKGYIAFSINHYQGKYNEDPAAVKGYTDYMDYYLDSK